MEPASYACPHCDAPVAVRDEATELTCPACQQPFSLPQADTTPEEPEDLQTLSAARVRLLSARKRSLLRTRTYILVSAMVLAVAAIALVIKSVQGTVVMGGVGVRQGLLFLSAMPCGYLAGRLLRLYRQHTKLLLASDLPEPTAPPDFSTLSNGDQRWKNLERIR